MEAIMDVKPTGALVDICVLAAVSRGDRGREAILRDLGEVVEIGEEALAEALSRLTGQGFLEAYEWPSGGGDRALFRLTALGECLLERSLGDWEDYVRRVDRFLHPPGASPRRGAGAPVSRALI